MTKSFIQFPERGGLLWRETEKRGEGSDSELRLHALVRVLQRLQERLGTAKQEHLQGEVRLSLCIRLISLSFCASNVQNKRLPNGQTTSPIFVSSGLVLNTSGHHVKLALSVQR